MLGGLVAAVLLAAPLLSRGASAHPCCAAQKPANGGFIDFGSHTFLGCPSGGRLSYAIRDLAVECSCSQAQVCNTTSPAAFSFVCGDGTVLPASKVNDQWCDCGVDEPATSACSRASSSAVFLCINEGLPVLLPSSRVDDSVIDCCDGTDEPNLLGYDAQAGCARFREEVMRKRFAKATLAKAGLEAKSRNPPPAVLTSLQQELAELKSNTVRALEKRDVLKAELDTVDVTEKRRRDDGKAEIRSSIVQSLPAGALTRLVVETLLKKSDFELDVALVVLLNVPTLGEALRALGDVNALTKKLRNDEAVADKVQGISALLRLEEVPGDIALRIIRSETDRALLDMVSLSLPEDGLKELFTKLALVEGDSAELSQHRRDYDAAQSEVKQLEESAERLSRALNSNLGPQSMLAPLIKARLSLAQGEFEYVVDGAFSQAEQRKPASPNEPAVSLGRFDSWKWVKSPSDVPEQVAEGEDFPFPRVILEYTDGRRCQAGPRTAALFVRCGANDSLVRVVEPSPCRYLLLASSPSVCTEDDALPSSWSASAAGNSTSWSSLVLGWMPSWLTG